MREDLIALSRISALTDQSCGEDRYARRSHDEPGLSIDGTAVRFVFTRRPTRRAGKRGRRRRIVCESGEPDALQSAEWSFVVVAGLGGQVAQAPASQGEADHAGGLLVHFGYAQAMAEGPGEGQQPVPFSPATSGSVSTFAAFSARTSKSSKYPLWTE